MEPLFVVEGKVDEATYIEVWTGKGKPWFALVYQFAGLYFVLKGLGTLLDAWTYGPSDLYLYGVLILMCGGGLIWFYSRHYVMRQAKKNYQVQCNFYGTDKSGKSVFWEDHFAEYNPVGGLEFDMKYEDILKVSETKNTYCYTVRGPRGYFVSKKDFVVGTPEEFKEFIRIKAVKADIQPGE
ncbi:MAG: YcxB family protein [Firmicutes bacterium]|nr:YcxB family protein [Bacillota bacterium]